MYQVFANFRIIFAGEFRLLYALFQVTKLYKLLYKINLL